VLKDVNFRVNSGETVALVVTGSELDGADTGSTTLQDGAVFGWQAMCGTSRRNLRRHIGPFSQRTVLISPGLCAASAMRYDWADDAVVEAAIAVNHEFIEALPQGYDTKLEERGGNLSQEQQQLLGALVADATKFSQWTRLPPISIATLEMQIRSVAAAGGSAPG
jgi:ATP-binding cassette subfamily B protein